MAKQSGTKKAKKQAAQKKPAASKPKVARATAEKPKAAAVKSETPPKAIPNVPPTPTDETVVFAIRLKRSERDAIHEAAGSGKASQFVRELAVAAARGDVNAVKKITEAALK